MVMRNYIELVPGRPTRLRFADWSNQQVTRFDATLGREKPLNTLLLQVYQMDGVPVTAFLSVSSDKLKAALEPHLVDGSYKAKVFEITPRGEGFSRSYTVTVLAPA